MSTYRSFSVIMEDGNKLRNKYKKEFRVREKF